MKEKKNLIIILILLVGVVGITIAYFSNTTSIDNLFSTKKYGSTITEEFISPDSWLPGDETDKSIVATNTGEVDQAVRISYTEKWLDSNNNELNGWIHEDGTKSNHETELELNTDERVALINFDNDDDWTYKDGYYYYNYKLSPNESTSSLIKSVTFNPKTKLDDTCTTTISDGKKTITCSSSGSDYDNARYTLTFKIETVQFNKYMNAWNTDVAILEEQVLFCDAFEVGEVVTYNNAEYYVLKDSSTSDDYVTLLKKDPLTASEVNQYSDSYVSQDGEYPYFESDTCNENNQTGCSTNYDTSDVKKIVDGWSSTFGDDLVGIDGYKTRLINEDDISFEKTITPSSTSYSLSKDIPRFIYIVNDYWISIQLDDSITNIPVIDLNEGYIINKVYSKNYVRPVINLKKNILQCNCSTNDFQYKAYNMGEKIIYDNEEYYVLKDSNKNSKYVTLLKDNVLTVDEINLNSIYESNDGKYSYCTPNCATNYENSYIKIIIDNWAYKYKDDLVNMYGYKARLLGLNNEYDNLNEWVYSSNNPYWTMVKTYNNNYYVISNTLLNENDNNSYYIRPVINLKKCAIDGKCNKNNSCNNNFNNLYDYVVGNNVAYNNTNYCVIENSINTNDYVTLLKQEPLTYDELVIYNNGYEIGIDSIDNNSGVISYYKSDTCYYNSDTDKNTSGCSNDYNNSFIRNVVNNWSNQFNNDLKQVDGYKVRLITNDELNSMGHIFYRNSAVSMSQKSSYNCLYSNADYWTMSNTGDSQNEIDIVSIVDNNNKSQKVYSQFAVRPVINLKKCAIDNTCE